MAKRSISYDAPMKRLHPGKDAARQQDGQQRLVGYDPLTRALAYQPLAAELQG